jgi:hypothetical protein
MRDLGNPAPVRHVLGSYELLEEIGRGGMGIVYRALDLSLDRVVAVKVLRDDLRAQQQIVTRFAREARAAAQLDHPNIVQIFSVGAADRTPYIAMEYVDAAPLSMIMHRDGPMPCERALDIALQVASALNCAHAAGVIHRDIKPPNVLMNDAGQAFVTDFGIAKILSIDDNLTVDGSRLGTPHYMSPERCRNGEVTASSDFFSLGVVLFQMLTGQLPYDAHTSVEMIQQIVSMPPARVRKYRPDLTEDVERLVAWLMEPRPKNRPANGKIVCDAIARVRDGKPLDDGPSPLASALAAFRDSMGRSRADIDTAREDETRSPRMRLRGRHIAVGIALSLAVVLASAGIVGKMLSGAAPANTSGFIVHDPSLWLMPVDVVTFRDETTEVTLARLNLKGLGWRRLGWSGDLLVAQLVQGESANDCSGDAIVAINPNSRTARFVAPPLNREYAPARAGFDIVGFGGIAQHFLVRMEGTENAAGLIRCSAGSMVDTGLPLTVVSDASPGTAGLDAERFGAMAIHPNGDRFAAAIRQSVQAELLAEFEVGPDGRARMKRRLAPIGPKIMMVDYAANGSLVVYGREFAGGNRSLYMTSVEPPGHEESPIAHGDIQVAPGLLSDQGDRLVYTESAGGTVRRIRLVTRDFSNPASDLGEGFEAAWRRGRNEIVATAPDRMGNPQLWQISANAPHVRRQITHLDSGTAAVCSVSSDGRWAATASSNDPAEIVLANLNAGEAELGS